MTFKGDNIGDRPTLAQVEIYVAEKGFYFDVKEFFEKYERRNWLTTNGQPIKSLEDVCDAYIGVDASDDNDYTGLTIIDTKHNTIASRILRTDNPDPNSWLYGFINEMKESK